MKKLLIILCLLSAVCLTMFGCSDAKPVGIEIINPPTNVSYAVDDTVSFEGLTVKIKYDDDSYSDAIDVSSLTLPSVDTSTSGTKTVTVKYSIDEKEYQADFTITIIEPHVHTYAAAWERDATHHWHVATCEHNTEKGNYAEHDWNDGEITAPATCTEKGVKTFTCTVCGNTKTEDVAIDATAHDWNEWAITTSATCLKAGEKTRICKHNAQHVETDEVPIDTTAHDLEHHDAKAATCTEVGWNAYDACRREGCDYTSKVELEALGHNYATTFTTDIEPTCTEDGSKSKHCSRCDSKTEETAMDALEHTYGEWISNNDGTHTRSCGRDNTHIETENCSGGTATCKDKAVCSDCHTEYGELSVTHGATEIRDAVAATCTVAGYTGDTYCTVCGVKTITGEAVDALGHTYGNWISNGNDTHTRTCGRDNTHTETENCSGGTATCKDKAVCADCHTEYGELSAIHDYSSSWSTDDDYHWHECSVCKDKKDNAAHNLSTKYADDGHWQECACGYKTSKTSHNYGYYVPNHVFTQDGTSCTATLDCKGCDYALTETVETAPSILQAQSCTNPEITRYTAFFTVERLQKNNLFIDKETKAALGHDFTGVEWSSKNDGTHTRACTRGCGGTETEDCTYVEGVCSECGYLLPTEGLAYTLSADETYYSVGKGTANSAKIVIASVYNGKPVTAISDFEFVSLSFLTEVIIPSSITSIGMMAFGGCINLTDITIPNGVVNIGMQAFCGCVNLTDVSLPASVLSIGERAFSYCPILSEITVDENNPNYCVLDGNLYDKSKTTLLRYASGKSQTAFTVPVSVTTIASKAFDYSPALETVNFAEGSLLTTINVQAFASCGNLQTVTFAEDSRLVTVNESAFDFCTSLTEIILPSSVDFVGAYAFNGCTSLTSVYIPEGVSTMRDNVFEGCTNLTIFCGAASVDVNWSEYWNNLARPVHWGHFTAAHSCGSWGSNTNATHTRACTVAGCTYMETENCSGGTATCISKAVCSRCGHEYGETLGGHIGGTATCICKAVCNVCEQVYGDYAAHDYVQTPDGSGMHRGICSICGMEDFAVGYCSYGVATCTQRETCTVCGGERGDLLPHSGGTATCIQKAVCSVCEQEYGDYAAHTWVSDVCTVCGEVRNGTEGLKYNLNGAGTGYSVSGYTGTATAVKIPSVHPTDGKPVIDVKEYAFAYNKSIRSVVIPSSITSIGGNAFYYCEKLNSINLPEGLTTIGNMAFNFCSVLTGIIIPSSVTSIGEECFSYCGLLDSITVESGNTVYHSKDNCLIETASKKLVRGGNESEIPSDGTVTMIGVEAFNYCKKITSIALSDNIVKIDTKAFYGCAALLNITYPDSLIHVGSQTLDGTAWMAAQSVNSLVYNNKWCVGHKGSLTGALVISEGTVGIACSIISSAFTSISLPSTLNYITTMAFMFCNGFTSLYIPASVEMIVADAFSYCDNLTTIECGAASKPAGWATNWQNHNSKNPTVTFGVAAP